MENGKAKDMKITCMVFELVGTCFVTYGLCEVGIGEAPLLGLYGMIAMWTTICWHFSGGHFNPSITLAAMINSKDVKGNLVPALLMMAGQLAGGFLGIFFSWLVLDSKKFFNNATGYKNVDYDHTIPDDWVFVLAPFSASYGNAYNPGLDLG